MIEKLTITNYLNESIFLELRRPEKSGYLVALLEGLTPVSSNLSVSESYGVRGGSLQTIKIGTRTINLGLLFMDHPHLDISQLRERVYNIFQISKPVKFIIDTNKKQFGVSGVVESLDASMFSKACGASINILCPDPNIYSLYRDSKKLETLDNIFEFPYPDGLKFNELIFSKIDPTNVATIRYDGQVPAGIILTINVLNNNIYKLKITKSFAGFDEFFELNLGKLGANRPQNGNVVYISTEYFNKYVHIFKSPTLFNGIAAVDTKVDWFLLNPGLNNFKIEAFDNNNVKLTNNTTMSYLANYKIYEGI